MKFPQVTQAPYLLSAFAIYYVLCFLQVILVVCVMSSLYFTDMLEYFLKSIFICSFILHEILIGKICLQLHIVVGHLYNHRNIFIVKIEIIKKSNKNEQSSVFIMIYYWKIDYFVFRYIINEKFMLSSKSLLLVGKENIRKRSIMLDIKWAEVSSRLLR